MMNSILVLLNDNLNEFSWVSLSLVLERVNEGILTYILL